MMKRSTCSIFFVVVPLPPRVHGKRDGGLPLIIRRCNFGSVAVYWGYVSYFMTGETKVADIMSRGNDVG